MIRAEIEPQALYPLVYTFFDRHDPLRLIEDIPQRGAVAETCDAADTTELAALYKTLGRCIGHPSGNDEELMPQSAVGIPSIDMADAGSYTVSVQVGEMPFRPENAYSQMMCANLQVKTRPNAFAYKQYRVGIQRSSGRALFGVRLCAGRRVLRNEEGQSERVDYFLNELPSHECVALTGLLRQTLLSPSGFPV